MKIATSFPEALNPKPYKPQTPKILGLKLYTRAL